MSKFALDTVPLGRTDLRVTRYCQGTAFRHLGRHADDPMAEAVLRHALDVGVNFFDSAHAYGWGGAEQLLGKVLEGRRDEVVLCTKIPASLKPVRENEAGAPGIFTLAYLSDQLDAALKRLRTDYIDLYLLHQPDHVTPAEEVCASMDGLVQSGKIRHWGVSNHEADQISACVAAARRAGTHPPVVTEDYYTIAGYALTKEGHRSRIRKLENELFPVLRDHGLGLVAFGPMDAGQLSPTYEASPNAPLATMHQVLDESAEALGVTRAQICVAWVLAHPEVTSVLAGPEHPDHVDDMLAAISLDLPTEIRTNLDAASLRYSRAIESP